MRQNYKKAVDGYTKVVNQGYDEAQYNLGVCYENGNGVKQDYQKAKYWYSKAADQGNKNAEAAYESL